MQLNYDDLYSKLVCTACDEQLKNFSILQKDFITKQLKLQKFVGDSEEKQKRKAIDIKGEANDYVESGYLNPLVIIKLEPEQDPHEVCNYDNHLSEFEGAQRTRQMPEIVRKHKGPRKYNDPNK